ncbi:MAG: nuclear transport factor 2 family protein [Pseudomonadota bacterium]
MALDREALLDLAINQYFIGCNNHDLDAVMNTFADDCVMWFPASTFRYDGKAPLLTHFKDFLGTFPTVNFHDFINTVDPESQSITSRFKVQLIDEAGEEVVMRNCNFFYVNDDGLFNEIVIYNTSPIQKGFEAGSD